MHCLNGRVIRPEILDETDPERAEPSVNDLVRINRYLGGHEVLRKTLRDVVQPPEQFSMLDIGAASGDAGQIVRSLRPQARVVSLDYKLDHMRKAPPPRVVGDAFAIPVKDKSFDYTFCSLFLHHFSNDEVLRLLQEMRRVARRQVIVTDLERHPLAYYGLQLTNWLFRWDPITLHDGPISVEAAFHRHELEELAKKAGLAGVVVHRHRPAFRLAMVGAAT